MTKALAAMLLAIAVPSKAYVPTSDYHEERIEGFTVLISPEAASHPTWLRKLRDELRDQLRVVSDVLPDGSLPALRRTRIWIEWRNKEGTAAEFHSSEAWLWANEYNPEKFSGIEINNTVNFVTWSHDLEAPIILHELAHAYLASLSDYEQLLIHLAYLDARDSGSYELVRHRDGQERRALAMTDTQEYFAELTVAYFSRNHCYPFLRSELKTHDPQGFSALTRAWGAAEDRAAL
ncbi:MAG: hypothetical protein U1D69_01855 [Polynucleobacter sp.]|nr:hypothetical protein [Polynucleobacter sp.]